MTHLIDILGVICSFSIGLAGFSGIAAVFAGSRELIDEPLRFRLSIILAASFAPGFLSLAVMSVLLADIPEFAAVRVGSALLLCYLVGWLIFARRTLKRLGPLDMQKLNRRIGTTSRILNAVNCAAQALNVAIASSASAAVLVGGLSMTLLTGAITFASLVMRILKTDPNA